MKKTIKRWLIMILVSLTATTHLVCATEGVACVQSYVAEQSLIICTDAPLDEQAASCNISSQFAEIQSVGDFTDEDTAIQTIVMLDISTSMPSSMQDDILSLLEAMIANKAENECYCLCTISDGVHILQDFSSDRYNLLMALQSIQFNGQESRIYDAIFNSLSTIDRSDEAVTLYRVIVITDGIDDTTSGITKEELFLQLQSQRYPIDIVSVTTSDNGENKDLAAIARMSKGRYFSLLPTSDHAAFAAQLSVSQFGFAVASIPDALLDGVVRQVDFTDGAVNLSFDMKFPVSDVEPAPAEIVVEEPLVEEPLVEEPAPEKIVIEENEKEEEDEGDEEEYISASVEAPASWWDTYWLLISCALALVLLIILIVVLVKRKKSTVEVPTAMLELSDEPPAPESTQHLSARDTPVSCSFFTIKISQINAENQVWTLPVVGDLRIGRGVDCEIHIDDQTVSREHCKIVPHGNHLAIVHLGSSNKTKRNGATVKDICLIASGDIIMMGRAALQIDYIQRLDKPTASANFEMDDEKTEYIF